MWGTWPAKHLRREKLYLIAFLTSVWLWLANRENSLYLSWGVINPLNFKKKTAQHRGWRFSIWSIELSKWYQTFPDPEQFEHLSVLGVDNGWSPPLTVETVATRTSDPVLEQRAQARYPAFIQCILEISTRHAFSSSLWFFYVHVHDYLLFLDKIGRNQKFFFFAVKVPPTFWAHLLIK